jgi:hypothetical protein
MIFNNNDIDIQSGLNILYNQFISTGNLFEKEEKKEKNLSDKAESFKAS